MSRKVGSSLLLLAMTSGVVLHADCVMAASRNVAVQPAEQDPYQWLEDVGGERSLAWVRERNERTLAELTDSEGFAKLEGEIRSILDSDERIPAVVKIGDDYYNYWQDKANPRGIWRRTSLAEYRKPEPQWSTVLDLDAVNKAEGKNWVWKGAQCLAPEHRRCLLRLSRGGADADVTREYDVVEKRFVEDGFVRPEAKGSLAWIDQDSVLVTTDFGPGTTNKAGYPRMVKIWRRGTPLASATPLFEGPADNAGYGIRLFHQDAPGYERELIVHYLDSRDTALYLRTPEGVRKVEVPDSAEKDVHHQYIGITLREDWNVAGRSWKSGSFLVSRLDDVLAGKHDFDVLFEPTERTSLSSVTWTRDHLVLNTLQDVKSRLTVYREGDAGWVHSPFVGAPEMGTVSLAAVDPDASDAVWMTVSDFLSPTTLSIAEIGKAPEPLKAMPAFFDGSSHEVMQYFATSKDGTKVPYFVVQPRGIRLDGHTPTLMTGYGGFEISRLPTYLGPAGKAWIERGGAYVLANIRGGGEYGPGWHQAALKANRHRAYEDFVAVARDLAQRGISSPQRLGIQGGSNGGLLMGNMLTQYPEDFGAILVQVPLLDMRRYTKLLAGASWMAEYGDPDKPEEWAFIRTFSPYHLFDASRRYPPTMFTTSTRDDRVHPAHARKMMARMESAGKDVRYYENIEGGHGGAADNAQRARMQALGFTFLWDELTD